jgi:hypothetical protein
MLPVIWKRGSYLMLIDISVCPVQLRCTGEGETAALEEVWRRRKGRSSDHFKDCAKKAAAARMLTR